MPTVAAVCAFLDRFAPPALAADWDNVGLLLGDEAAEVGRVVTCLTVTPNVVAEAIDEKADLIVTHHPILFRGAKRLSTTTAEGRLLWPLARAGVAVYSPHTAFDNTVGPIGAHSINWKVFLSNGDVFGVSKTDRKIRCTRVV